MRRLLALVLIAASAVLAVPLPASAGGPTSVLITDPSSGRATALYYVDARYQDLDALLFEASRLDGEPARLGERSVNLTWMIHDVQPWRTQQVYPDAVGGPVVASYDTEVTGGDGAVTWARIRDRAELKTVLGQIFSDRFRPTRATEVAAPSAAPSAPAPEVVERTVTETETDWYSLTGWRWLFPGLILGAGLALLAGRRRADDAEPRQLLTEAPVGADLSAPR